MNEETTAREIAIPNPIAVTLDPQELAEKITAEHKAVQRGDLLNIGANSDQQMIVDSTNPAANVAKANLRRRYLADSNRVSYTIIAIRWITIIVGLIFATMRIDEGNLGLVATVAIMVFITSYRSINPITFDNAQIDTSSTLGYTLSLIHI